MEHTPVAKRDLRKNMDEVLQERRYVRRRLPKWTQVIALLLLGCVLSTACALLWHQSIEVYAADPGPGNTCSWYHVLSGDTLSGLASFHHTDIWTLARINHIPNPNLIYVGQILCIPYPTGGQPTGSGGGGGGLSANGGVRWYDYSALEWSSHAEVASVIRQVAARYGLPARLMLAISWQESGWNQHVISPDGGIGAMQIMPYTAMGLNAQTHSVYNPYKLWDNVTLSAIYLRTLWQGFHGNLAQIISAYNEGGWNVTHRGIFNWRYVDDVLALMQRF